MHLLELSKAEARAGAAVRAALERLEHPSNGSACTTSATRRRSRSSLRADSADDPDPGRGRLPASYAAGNRASAAPAAATTIAAAAAGTTTAAVEAAANARAAVEASADARAAAVTLSRC